MHACQKLNLMGHDVIGIDNINDYYDVDLKQSRLNCIKSNNFKFKKMDINDKLNIEKLFFSEKFDFVLHLAAQAGVRYSIKAPQKYIDTNITGFLNILECSKMFDIKHLLYASSSSVYGSNTKIPFKESSSTDHPMSMYAVTKKTNELMAHSYSHLYSLPTTGVRFFTVYGPWGRPDMALTIFAKAIHNNEVLKIFNNGDLLRGFTYIDDIVDGIFELLFQVPIPNKNFDSNLPISSLSSVPYAIYNIGNSTPIKLMEYISILEKEMGKTSQKEFLPMQAGDASVTAADLEKIKTLIGYSPRVSIEKGIKKFVEWYKVYYKY